EATGRRARRGPADDFGSGVTWSGSLLGSDILTVGGDMRLIAGESQDAFFNAAGTAVINRRTSGGRQNFFGVFAQEVFSPLQHLEITTGARVDSVASSDGRVSGSNGVIHFPSTEAVPVSARLGLRYDLGYGLAARGAGYRAFRAPTLAELYRRSSVEDLVLTQNPHLRPEYLEGGELGF